MPVDLMSRLYAAAHAKDSVIVKYILKEGVEPNCNGIHTTCLPIRPPSLPDLSDISDDEISDPIALLMESLKKQLEINKQQGTEIQFLTKANEEAAAHGFISTIQKEIAIEHAAEQELEIKRTESESIILKEKAEQHQKDLFLQQQTAEAERLRQEQQLILERQQAEQRRVQEIAATELSAKQKFQDEQAKIAARIELDRPYGGLHHESHMRRRLHVAALEKNPKEITRLINAGATIDVPDSFKHTPLWYAACETRHIESVQALVKCGAKIDKDIQDTFNRMNKGPNAGQIAIIRNIIRQGC